MLRPAPLGEDIRGAVWNPRVGAEDEDEREGAEWFRDGAE
jgi:hypothetical protein